MKKIGILLMFGLVFLFTGCLDDDNYSLSDMWVGFGILKETGDNPVTYNIVMDNDDVLIPIESNFNNYYDYNHTPIADGDRVLVNYTILDDNADENGEATEYYIKINSIRKILMKDILNITEENQDSIGNDPIIVKDVWVTDSLLNFEIKYWGYDKIHFINLVKQPGELTESDIPVQLELRHNNNDDLENIPYVAYVSFKLNNLEISGLDSVQFKVSYTDYDGIESNYEGSYHPGSSN